MKKFFSRYHPRYLRSLVYMLQASEYQTGEYWQWLRRVGDFRKVEKRKTLVFTPKAIIFYTALWIVVALAMTGVVRLAAAAQDSVTALLVSGGILLLLPLALPYVLLGLLVPFRILIQYPAEWWLIRQAKRTLKRYPAIKIAVAGSYGKTTFKEILTTILATSKRVASTPGNMNTPIGLARFIKKLTGQEEVLVFEFGEYYPGDVKKLARLVKPQIGIITGINEAHLDKFKNLAQTTATIFELKDFLPAKSLYVNGEDVRAKAKAGRGNLLYSRRGVGGWRVTTARTSLAGTVLEAKNGQRRLRATSKLLGLHQVGPLAAAIDLAAKLGLSDSQIQKGINSTAPFAHRLQPQHREGGVIVIDDTYNGNPDGVAAAIDFLQHIPAKRKIYVTPGLVETGSQTSAIHQAIGRKLAKAVDKVVLIRNSVTPYIADGLTAAKFKGEIKWFDDALECYRALDIYTSKGDVVLLQNDWPDNYA